MQMLLMPDEVLLSFLICSKGVTCRQPTRSDYVRDGFAMLFKACNIVAPTSCRIQTNVPADG